MGGDGKKEYGEINEGLRQAPGPEQFYRDQNCDQSVAEHDREQDKR